MVTHTQVHMIQDFVQPQKKNYSITEPETLAVIYCLEHFRDIIIIFFFFTFKPVCAVRHYCLFDFVQRQARWWRGRGFIVGPEQGLCYPTKLIFIAMQLEPVKGDM